MRLLVAILPAVLAASAAPQASGQKESTVTTASASDTFVKPPPDELRRRLTPQQFHVTQEEGTEPPFRNPYWDNHEAGIYVDVVSGERSACRKYEFNSISEILDEKNVRCWHKASTAATRSRPASDFST